MHADHGALAAERQHHHPQFLKADQVLWVAPVEGIQPRLVEEDHRPRSRLAQPTRERQAPRQDQPEDLPLDRLALRRGGERLSPVRAQHPAQREGTGELHLGEAQLALLHLLACSGHVEHARHLPQERPQRLPGGGGRQEALHAVVALQRLVQARIERARRAAPVAQIELRIALGIRAQPMQSLQGLRHHVLGGVAPGQLGRRGNVQEQRLLQRQLELGVRQASDAAGGERRQGPSACDRCHYARSMKQRSAALSAATSPRR